MSQDHPANTSRRVIDAFTEMAPNYEQTVDRELRQFWGVSYQDFIELLLDQLDAVHAHVILDVATGRGAIPIALARRPHWQGQAVGLDITAGMLRGAAERVMDAGEERRINLACGSGMQLPLAAGSFDAVICALATHHMNVRDLLREARRVLRSGGQLLIADVAPAPFWFSRTGRLMLYTLAWWYGRQGGGARMAAEMDALPNMRTPEQWRGALTEAGFDALKVVAIPARQIWYPRGILIHTLSNHTAGNL